LILKSYVYVQQYVKVAIACQELSHIRTNHDPWG